MAGDWIKTRVWLCRDPKVIRMADFLAEQSAFIGWLTNPVQASCRESAYEHVTRNVTVALCVTGLVVTWGTARERGNREGDDLVLDCCELEEISAVADIPCFGEAMQHVGWAIQREDDCVVFPKFFKEQESPDDRHKRQNAERQSRFRAKQEQEEEPKRNARVTQLNNVTVTTEKRREEVKEAESYDSLVWNHGLKIFTSQGMAEKEARSFIGMLLGKHEEADVQEAIEASAGKTDAKSYVRAILKTKPFKGEKKMGLVL